jgi:PhnB protein
MQPWEKKSSNVTNETRNILDLLHSLITVKFRAINLVAFAHFQSVTISLVTISLVISQLWLLNSQQDSCPDEIRANPTESFHSPVDPGSVRSTNSQRTLLVVTLSSKSNLTISKEDGNMTTVNPYLNFNGNTEEAFNFYRSVFGGEFLTVMRFKDNPQCDGISEADKDKVMHIALPIGSGTILMATDALESLGQKLTFGNNLYIALAPETREEAARLFNGLSAGGKVEMPLQDMFWGGYFGSFTDKFGVRWMVNQSNNNQ